MNYKLLKSEIKYHGKVFDHQVDEIQYDSGNIGIREVAVHPGGAVVIPIKDDGKIILVKQFRYPLQKTLIELPAGKLDKNEDPLKCATRELEEETGYKAKHFEKLGAIYTAPGYCTEILHIYKATGLIAGNHNREEGEQGMELLEFSLDEIKKKILSGEINDAKTIAGIFYLAQK
ncbi:NUDIX hydrolase [Ignavibacterium sp.]|uniref:NUDIX hydrolase n=1 Tax=Ignavibacterium sp. TaxID=2651167 RepID=UPI0022071829|nr:NUDIX hydrolase [Ignavibacterium sp.]BDQ03220.1 MAG: ADP-ribose pyrophosphatase [Ignavibacterium sp.]